MQAPQPSTLTATKCTAQACRLLHCPPTPGGSASQKQGRQVQALTETFQRYEVLTLQQPKG